MHILILNLIASLAFTLKSHSDFMAGSEGVVLSDRVIKWSLGASLFSPATGGLRLLAVDMDLDDNGFEDIIIATDSVEILYRNETGYSRLVLPGGDPQGITVQDINFDGKPELIVASREGESIIYYNEDGGYNPGLKEAIISNGAQYILPCDVNGDGYIDLVVSNSGHGGQYNVSSYLLYGPPPFTGRPPDREFEVPGAHQVSCLDVNGDGYLDLVFSSERTNSGTSSFLYIFWGDSSGVQTDSFSVVPSILSWSHAFADFNNDGFLDVVIDIGAGPDRLYWGSEGGYMSYIPLRGANPGHLLVYDVNADGLLDIIESQKEGPLYISFGPDYTYFQEIPLSGSRTVSFVDFNGGPYIDLLAGDDVENKVKVFEGNGNGFNSIPIVELPVSEIDDGLWRERGNFFNRDGFFYISPVLHHAGDTIKVDSIRLFGEFPGNTQVDIFIRWGFHPDSLGIFERFSLSNETFPSPYIQIALHILPDWRYTSKFRIDSIKIFYHIPQYLLRNVDIVPPLIEDTLMAGDQRLYTYKLVNLGELPLFLELDTLNTTGIANYKLMDSNHLPLTDQNGDGYLDIGRLYPQDTFSLLLGVQVEDSVPGGLCDTLLIRVFSIDGVQDSALYLVFIKERVSVNIYPDRIDSTDPGVSVDLLYFIRNDGDSIDAGEIAVLDLAYPFNLFDTLGNPLPDLNTNGLVETGPIPPGDSVAVVLEVVPPPGVYLGERDTGIVRVYSTRSLDMSDFAYAIIKIKGELAIKLRVPTTLYVVGNGGEEVEGTVILKGVKGDTLEFLIRTRGGWVAELKDSIGEVLPDVDGDGYIEYGPILDTVTTFRLSFWGGEEDTSLVVFLVRSSNYPLLQDSLTIRVARVSSPRLKVMVSKNGRVYFKVKSALGGIALVKIYDRSGRKIREIERAFQPSVESVVEWDGRDSRGVDLVPGVYIYYVELRTTGGEVKKFKGRVLKER